MGINSLVPTSAMSLAAGQEGSLHLVDATLAEINAASTRSNLRRAVRAVDSTPPGPNMSAHEWVAATANELGIDELVQYSKYTDDDLKQLRTAARYAARYGLGLSFSWHDAPVSDPDTEYRMYVPTVLDQRLGSIPILVVGPHPDPPPTTPNT
jgi:hypothetical protein